ncbi:hypothetical protein N9D23_12775 [Rubripirellula sp.]|nr:hypothetical protein [Rubripirellula sp.]
MKRMQSNTKTSIWVHLDSVPIETIFKGEIRRETYRRYSTHHHPGRHAPERRGSALLMLIIALAILISVYSTAIVKQAGQDLRAERERERIALLENALRAVAEIESPDANFFKLPVDVSKNDWIEVSKTMGNRDEVLFVAKLMHNGTELITVQRNELSLQ